MTVSRTSRDEDGAAGLAPCRRGAPSNATHVARLNLAPGLGVGSFGGTREPCKGTSTATVNSNAASVAIGLE